MHRNVRRHWQGLDVHVSVLRIERLKTAATLKRFSMGKARYTFGNGRRGQLIAIVARSLRATSCLSLSGRAGPLMCHLGHKLRTIVAGGGQRVVAMKGGRIIANGTPSECLCCKCWRRCSDIRCRSLMSAGHRSRCIVGAWLRKPGSIFGQDHTLAQSTVAFLARPNGLLALQPAETAFASNLEESTPSCWRHSDRRRYGCKRDGHAPDMVGTTICLSRSACD